VDDAYELVFAEAVRALAARRDALESLRGRAGVVLSGAAIASSLFGGRAVGAGLGPFAWAAIFSFLGLSLALLVVLWPRVEWQDAILPSWVIRVHIEVADPRGIGLIRRDLALELEDVYRKNTALYERLARSFRVAAVLLNFEVLGWILDLALRT
jgi:hypothetical protein